MKDTETQVVHIYDTYDLVTGIGRDISLGKVLIVDIERCSNIKDKKLVNHINIVADIELIYNYEYSISTQMCFSSSENANKKFAIDKKRLAESIKQQKFKLMYADPIDSPRPDDCVQVNIIGKRKKSLEKQIERCDSQGYSLVSNNKLIFEHHLFAKEIMTEVFDFLSSNQSNMTLERMKLIRKIHKKVKGKAIKLARSIGMAD